MSDSISQTIKYDGLKEHKVQCGTCLSLKGYDIIGWEPNNTEDIVIVCKNCGQRYAGKLKLEKIIKNNCSTSKEAEP